MHLIVLKKYSIKRNLTISLLLILLGITLINPFQAKANPTQTILRPSIFYLYPMPNEMFFLESNPKAGYATLQEWSKVLPKGEMIVATDRQLASYGGLDRIGKYVQGKLMGRSYNGKYDKDVFKYRRTVTAEGVTDEVEVEIGKHFKNSENIDNLIGQVKKHLTTDAGETKEIKDKQFPPVPEPKTESKEEKVAKIQIVGGVSLAGGLVLLLKLLPILAL